jgi:hypothetical protein
VLKVKKVFIALFVLLLVFSVVATVAYDVTVNYARELENDKIDLKKENEALRENLWEAKFFTEMQSNWTSKTLEERGVSSPKSFELALSLYEQKDRDFGQYSDFQALTATYMVLVSEQPAIPLQENVSWLYTCLDSLEADAEDRGDLNDPRNQQLLQEAWDAFNELDSSVPPMPN